MKFKLIPVNKKPKEKPRNLGGRPKTRRDPFDFEGPFSVEWKRVRGPSK